MALGAVVHDAVINVENIDASARVGADDAAERRRGERRARGVARDRPHRRCGPPSSSGWRSCRSSSWTACRATRSSRPWPAPCLLALVASLARGHDGHAGAEHWCCCRRAATARSRRWRGGCRAATTRVLAPFARTAGAGARRHRSSCSATAAVVVPRFDKSLLPTLEGHERADPVGRRRSARRSPRWIASPRVPASELRAVPGVRNVGTQVGQAVLGDQAVGSDSAEMWVTIDRSADYDETVAAVRAGGRRLPRPAATRC